MTLLQALVLTAALSGQEKLQVFPLDPAVPGGKIGLPTEFVPTAPSIPEALEFSKRLGEEDWEQLRVRILATRPMRTIAFSAQDLAQLARLGGNVDATPVTVDFHGTQISSAWEVEFAEGVEDPIGMFGILVYLELPGRWVQVLVAAPSNHEDAVRASAPEVLGNLNLGRWGGAEVGPAAVIGAVMYFISAVLVLIGWIWGLVALFRDGQILWGVLGIICCGWIPLIYCIMNRDRLAAPMWFQVVGYVMMAIGIGLIIGTMGLPR